MAGSRIRLTTSGDAAWRRMVSSASRPSCVERVEGGARYGVWGTFSQGKDREPGCFVYAFGIGVGCDRLVGAGNF